MECNEDGTFLKIYGKKKTVGRLVVVSWDSWKVDIVWLAINVYPRSAAAVCAKNYKKYEKLSGELVMLRTNNSKYFSMKSCEICVMISSDTLKCPWDIWMDSIWFNVMCLHMTWLAIYSTSQEICTRFCCALLCCGYAIVHNEFTWSIYPYSSGLLCWHWGTVPVKWAWWIWENQSMYNHNKAQQSKNRVHFSWDIL